MKYIHSSVFDAALAVTATADKLTICSQPPTNYTEANSTYALGSSANVSFTGPTDSSGGRKLTVDAIASETITASGNANHAALLHTGSSTLLHVTPVFNVLQSTATSATNNTINLGSSASGTDDAYDNCAIVIYAGTGAGQTRMINNYVGSTKVATISTNWSTNPDSTSQYKIFGQPVTAGNTWGLSAWDVVLNAPAD